jgi:hypothetical protein
MKFTIDFCLTTRLWLSRAIPLFPLCAFMACLEFSYGEKSKLIEWDFKTHNFNCLNTFCNHFCTS